MRDALKERDALVHLIRIIKYNRFIVRYTVVKLQWAKKPMKTHETKQKFIELRSAGYSFEAISKKIDVSRQTLHNWSRVMEQEIAEQKNAEIENLRAVYQLAKKQRIETIGAVLSKINDEIASRDYSKIPTPKLIELALKVSETL